jgi:hypothetical protein
MESNDVANVTVINITRIFLVYLFFIFISYIVRRLLEEPEGTIWNLGSRKLKLTFYKYYN